MASETSTATVTAVTYPAIPNITADLIAGGRWSIHNTDGTLPVFASVDGVSDTAIIPPGRSWIVQQPQHSGQLWLRLASAGSVVVYATEELDATDMGTAFRWNQSDLTQFTSAGTADINSGFVAPALAVTADALFPGGNKLVFSATSCAASSFAIFFVDAVIPPGVYEARAYVSASAPGGVGEGLLVGYVFGADATDTGVAVYNGYDSLDATKIMQEIRNGADPSSTLLDAAANSAAGYLTCRWNLAKVAGASPQLIGTLKHLPSSSAAGVERFIYGTGWGADWAATKACRIGIIVRNDAGSASALSATIADFGVGVGL